MDAEGGDKQNQREGSEPGAAGQASGDGAGGPTDQHINIKVKSQVWYLWAHDAAPNYFLVTFLWDIN